MHGLLRAAGVASSPALRRWGNKLSNKLFMGKEFVLKHVRLKHAARMETERAKVGAGMLGPHPGACCQQAVSATNPGPPHVIEQPRGAGRPVYRRCTRGRSTALRPVRAGCGRLRGAGCTAGEACQGPRPLNAAVCVQIQEDVYCQRFTRVREAEAARSRADAERAQQAQRQGPHASEVPSPPCDEGQGLHLSWLDACSLPQRAPHPRVHLLHGRTSSPPSCPGSARELLQQACMVRPPEASRLLHRGPTCACLRREALRGIPTRRGGRSGGPCRIPCCPCA